MSISSFYRLLPQFLMVTLVAMFALTACGGGGGGSNSASSTSWLPYGVEVSSTGNTLHLVNTRTLADKELTSEYTSGKTFSLHPHQVRDDGRLLTLPASHLVYFDTSLNRFVRKALDGGGSTLVVESCQWVLPFKPRCCNPSKRSANIYSGQQCGHAGVHAGQGYALSRGAAGAGAGAGRWGECA